MALTNDQSTQSAAPIVNTNDIKTTAAATDDNLDFDINLDIATDETSQSIDINKDVATKPVETIVNQGEDLSLDLPATYSTENTEETKIDEKKETTLDAEKIDNNTRLQEQDQKNKEEERSLFASTSNNTTSDPLNTNSLNIDIPASENLIKEISPDSIAQIETLKNNISKLEPVINIDTNQTKSESYDINKSDYSSDMKIIEDLNWLKPAEQINESNSQIWATQTLNTDFNKKSDNIDLDSLIGKTTNENPDVSMTSISETTNTDNNALFPDFSKLTNENPDEQKEVWSPLEVKAVLDINSPTDWTIAGTDTKNAKHHNLWKMLLPIGWTVAVLAVLGYFIITTMYPVETQNIIWDETPQVVENTWDQQTGNIEDLSGWIDIAEAVEVVSGDMIVAEEPTDLEEWHWAWTELDSLWELTDEMLSQWQIEEQSTIDKLKSMSAEANSFLSQGQATNNKIYIKYGGTIEKKCNELISTLESWQEISNLDGNIAQLEGYLQKLRDISNAEPKQSSGTTQNTVVESGQTTTIGSEATAE